MTAQRSGLLCLDSGTTSVKAALFDRGGQLVASAERPNGALLRSGTRVEQDMLATRDDVFAVLKDCRGRADLDVDALLVTGQGDGLWAIDTTGKPVGMATTWLDGRARQLVAELDAAGQLASVRAVTGSRPTTATQSVQLLWLAQHEPERLQRIAYALRLKEWLYFELTGVLHADPSSVLPTWGNWRDGQTSRAIQEALGLDRGLELLADLRPVGAARAGLSADAARHLGLPAGVPVLQGPGDVQSTLIGLGLGTRAGVSRASIFGTSAIHASHVRCAAAVKDRPAGAMVLKFVLGEGYFSIHPCFNGSTLLQHLGGLIGAWPTTIDPAYSALIIHPFFELGGERAPYTTPDAIGSVIGMTAATTPAEIAWASRESLAFIARVSHDIMSDAAGPIALGGGLSNDRTFAEWFATVMRAPVLRSTNSHASLRGLAAIGARFVYGTADAELSERWIGAADETVAPLAGAAAVYAVRKFEHFARTIDALAPTWTQQSVLRRLADAASE